MPVPDKISFCDNLTVLFESTIADIEHGATLLTTEASIMANFRMLAFVDLCII